MGGDMSREACCEAVWDLHYLDDPAAMWELCQSLGKMEEFADTFQEIKKLHEQAVAKSVGFGVGAAFTGGALAGASAHAAAEAVAICRDFLAVCIEQGLKCGLFERPEPEGEDIIDHNDLNDLELLAVCKTLMREEHLASEYAVMMAVHDVWVTSVIKIAVCAAVDGGGSDLIDLGLEAEGLPDFFATMADIKERFGDVEDVQTVLDSPIPMLRNYIQLAMEKRKARQ
eukprot:CAMPEP_0197897100 /NCGR_PEP_ID=MMETSP1439-20131203/41660_1 /TAXON_ID=66791 /ORGANISM="Gonyaulax spinifera, Strain CCMP409" /LENGTH=227 /DNA_ID=CAMNT_0043517707 /DNA_START=65 /DNA_END=748 /DNA_ORIENTATION=+